MRKTFAEAFWLFALAMLFAGYAQAGDTVYYYYNDVQGNPVVVTDAHGNVVERTYYGPYGEVLNRPLRDGPGYTGHEEDAATGLVYMQQRYYDPLAKRFPTVDPVDVDPTTGANFNRYWYANDNPYRYTDPDGRDSVGEIIDENAQAAADSGNNVATYAWAFAGTAWGALGAESVSQVADKGSAASTGDKVMAAVSVVTLGKGGEAATVAKDVAEGAKDVAKEAINLTSEQAKNVERFTSKIPANAKDSVSMKALPNEGVAVQAKSPGRVPGSSAVYEKQIDSSGKTVQYTKTTYDPSGQIVHVKDKLNGG